MDFGLAFQELRESQQITQGAGFVPQNANHALVVEEYAAETVEAIENLADAAVHNQVTVQAVTVTNTAITQNLIEANQKLTEALGTTAALQPNGGGFQFGRRGPGRGRGAGRWGGVVGGGKGCGVGRGVIVGGRGRTVRMYNNKNYCHTHGYNIHDAHGSETCNTPGIGHQYDVTLVDIKGESQRNKNLLV